MSTVALLNTEWRLHRRHRVTISALAATTAWVALLLAVPESVRDALAPWIVFLDIAALGFLILPALTVMERANGVTAALRATRLAPLAFVLVRVGVMVAVGVIAGGAILTVAGTDHPVTAIVGVTLGSAFFSLLAVTMIGRTDSLTTYVGRVPFVAVPLLAPALIYGLGLLESDLLRMSPATAALRLMMGVGDIRDIGWLVVCCVGLLWAAERIGFDVTPASRRANARRPSRNPIQADRFLAWRSFARVDRTNVLGDRVVLPILVGVPILAAGLRWFNTGGAEWVDSRYGVDIAPYFPVLWTFLLVAHTPMMFGSVAGLMFLEDRDAGALPAIAATRSSLVGLVKYRLASAVAITVVMVILGFVFSGAHHPAGPFGMVLVAIVAGASVAVPTLLMASLARDRAQGMALMKAIGLPWYLPIAAWFLQGWPGLAFLALPSAWAAQAFWAPTIASTAAWAAGGVAFIALWTVVLGRRFVLSPGQDG